MSDTDQPMSEQDQAAAIATMRAQIRDAIAAQHAQLYDNHNPLRVKAMIEAMGQASGGSRTTADTLVLTAQLLAQALADVPAVQRQIVTAGTLSMVGMLVADLDKEAAEAVLEKMPAAGQA